MAAPDDPSPPDDLPSDTLPSGALPSGAVWWEPPPIARTLGLTILEADPSAGRVVVTFEPTDAFVNTHGHVQGGIVAAMLDATMGPALRVVLQEEQWAPTTDLAVRFMAPALPGTLTGHGRVVRQGATVAFTSAELFDADGTLLATATATAVVRGPRAGRS